MHIQQHGPVTERITLLGRPESNVYLVDGGGEYALLGGSMAYVAEDVAAQIRAMNIIPQKITRLIVHHAHFDHVGLVPFLKTRWPWLRVTATARARELLRRPDVIESILSLNRLLLPEEAAGLVTGGLNPSGSLDVETIEVDETVSDGDTLTCGDLSLEILEVPGHSSCSMAVYIPREKAMAASDAGGIPFGDRIFSAANSNFDLYQESLEKMAAFPTEVHLSEHYGALTGKAGAGFMKRSIEEAARMRTLLETAYARYQDTEKTVDAVLAVMEEEARGYFLPREVMALVLNQMVRFFERRFKGGRRNGGTPR